MTLLWFSFLSCMMFLSCLLIFQLLFSQLLLFSFFSLLMTPPLSLLHSNLSPTQILCFLAKSSCHFHSHYIFRCDEASFCFILWLFPVLVQLQCLSILHPLRTFVGALFMSSVCVILCNAFIFSRQENKHKKENNTVFVACCISTAFNYYQGFNMIN